MKRDRRSVLDLLSEQEEQLTFDMFQAPDGLIRQRLPDELKIKLVSPQGSVLLKILNKAAVMDPETYRDLYLKFQSAITGDGLVIGTDMSVEVALTHDEVMKLLNAIKLTDARLIQPRLGVRDAMWSLRQNILQRIGIEEVN